MATDCIEQLEKPSITKFPEDCATDLWQTWMLSQILGLPFWCVQPAGFWGVSEFSNSDCSPFLSSQLCTGYLTYVISHLHIAQLVHAGARNQT